MKVVRSAQLTTPERDCPPPMGPIRYRIWRAFVLFSDTPAIPLGAGRAGAGGSELSASVARMPEAEAMRKIVFVPAHDWATVVHGPRSLYKRALGEVEVAAVCVRRRVERAKAFCGPGPPSSGEGGMEPASAGGPGGTAEALRAQRRRGPCGRGADAPLHCLNGSFVGLRRTQDDRGRGRQEGFLGRGW